MSEIASALSAAQWQAVLSRADELRSLRAGFENVPFSSHALAALFLFEQPFGFSPQDVVDEEEVAGYCDAMVTQNEVSGDVARADAFRQLADRHRIRAEKIAALLPPPGVTR
jgi:hypothetical protein